VRCLGDKSLEKTHRIRLVMQSTTDVGAQLLLSLTTQVFFLLESELIVLSLPSHLLPPCNVLSYPINEYGAADEIRLCIIIIFSSNNVAEAYSSPDYLMAKNQMVVLNYKY
jgi:hypothetical protein